MPEAFCLKRIVMYSELKIQTDDGINRFISRLRKKRIYGIMM